MVTERLTAKIRALKPNRKQNLDIWEQLSRKVHKAGLLFYRSSETGPLSDIAVPKLTLSSLRSIGMIEVLSISKSY